MNDSAFAVEKFLRKKNQQAFFLLRAAARSARPVLKRIIVDGSGTDYLLTSDVVKVKVMATTCLADLTDYGWIGDKTSSFCFFWDPSRLYEGAVLPLPLLHDPPIPQWITNNEPLA